MRYTYEDEPNEGARVIRGIELGNEFLASFQYKVEVANEQGIDFRSGNVEVAFYNQFGQLLNAAALIHQPFNATGFDDDDGVVVFSPTLPMYEGRTQLLTWARNADGSPFTTSTTLVGGSLQFTVGTTLAVGSTLQCTPIFVGTSLFPPAPTANCITNATPAIAGLPNPIDVGVTPISITTLIQPGTQFVVDFPTTIGAITTTGTLVLTGATLLPDDWFFGPFVFQNGQDAGQFIFIDTDQGPPAPPFIDFFECQGTSNCVGAPLVVETPRTQISGNDPYRYKVVFNREDVENAVNSGGPSLIVSFHGHVLNDPSLFAGSLPGAVQKPESNAFLDSDLRPMRFTSTVAPEQARKTTGTGPFPIGIAGVPPLPIVTYPDEIVDFPYGTVVYDDFPVPLKYPFGPSLAPGLYQTVSFDFTSMVDGNYEIWITAEDVTSAITQNGQSPGAIGVSGDRIRGLTTVIQVIRDRVSPTMSLQVIPEFGFLIIGNNEEPPLPYENFQGEIFQVKGFVSDERGDTCTVDFDILDNLGAFVPPIGPPPPGGHFRSVQDSNGAILETFDFTPLDPNTTGTNPPPATGGQRAFEIRGVPTDPQLNTATTTSAVYVVKDLQAPQDPVIVSPSIGVGAIVTQTFMDLVVQSPNLDVPSGSFDDLREHGSVTMVAIIQEAVSGGKISSFTVQAQGLTTSSDSKLDNHPSWLRNDIFGTVFDRFEYRRTINLDAFADGPMILTISLVDQVGNASINTTSVSFIKDTLAPTVFFRPEHRLVSGPDNNYPIPNQMGANDEIYKISLISPEQVVDNGPGVAPTATDPGTQNLLHLQFGAKDASLPIDRVEISGAHIVDQLGVIASVGTTITSVEVDIDVSNLFEGIKEQINLRAFDVTNNAGIPNSVAVYRDLTPAIRPIIDDPAQDPLSTDVVVRTDQDTLTIKGHLTGKDSQLLNVENGDIFQSQVIVLTPKTGTPIVAGEVIPRVVRSSPLSVPRGDSFFSSFPDPATVSNFNLSTIDSLGNFQLTVDISRIPESPTTPTTIWVQAIDQFHNTDPAISAKGIEIFRMKQGLPVKQVDIVDFRNSGVDYTIFRSTGSVDDSIIATLFTGLEIVKFRVETIIPLTKAPDLNVTQFGAQSSVVTLLSNVDQIKGSRSFLYQYSVKQQRGQFDGRAALRVSGGLDLFKHSVIPSDIQTAFFVDSLAPNLAFISPGVIDEVPPLIFPSNGSRINTQNSTFSFNLVEFTGNGNSFQSGVDYSISTAVLQGPLAVVSEGFLDITSVVAQAGFDVSFEISTTLDDGVFRITMKATDKVGNSHRFYSSFIFDDTPVSGPLISTKPSNHEITSYIPRINDKQVIQINIERQDVDINQTQLIVVSPSGNEVLLDPQVVIDNKNINFPISNEIVYDGSADGTYILSMIVMDLVGNITHKTHDFLLDTAAPQALSFFPSINRCVKGPFSLADSLVQDLPGRNDLANPIPVSGISDKSSLKLVMNTPSGKLVELNQGFEQQGENKLISVDDFGVVGQKKVAFLLGDNSTFRNLSTEGTEDGQYKLDLSLYDSAGNHTTTQSYFYYDSQFPSVYLSTFSEGKIFIKTSSFFFEMAGVVQDEGPCNFFTSQEAHNGFTTLEFELNSYDIDNELSVGSLLPLTTILDLSPISPPDFPYLSSQASFDFSTRVDGVGVFTSPYVKLDVSVSDQVGNKIKQSKVFELVSEITAVADIISPPKKSVIDGLETTYITSDFVHEVRWDSGRGIKEVELEIYRYSQSLNPYITAKFDANLHTSGPISFAKGLGITGKENFGLRLRAIDQQGKAGDFGPIQELIIDARVPQISQLFIVQNGVSQNLSLNQGFVTTSIFQLQMHFDQKMYAQGGIVDLTINDYTQKAVITAATASTLSTDILVYDVVLPIDKKMALPRSGFQLVVSDFKSIIDVKMSSYEKSLIGDLGPDIDVRVFANPVSDFELIAVTRFLSYINRLEPVVIRRDSQGKMVSPVFRLRRNFNFDLLQATPISSAATPNRADSFSIPLNLARSDAGFYFLNVLYEDTLGRIIEREWEISLGKYQKSLSFVLKNTQSKSLLRVNSEQTGQDILAGKVFLTSRSKTSAQTVGELLYLGDLSEFGSSKSLSKLVAHYESQRLQDLSDTKYLSLMRLQNGVYEFYKKIEKPSNGVELALGGEYYLVQDLKAPEIRGETDSEYSYGWQDLNLEVHEEGTGLDPNGLKVSVEGYGVIDSAVEDNKLFVNFPKEELADTEMKIEIADNSGRKSILKKSVSIYGGEGIKWAQLAPNPIFRYQDLNLRFFILGANGEMKISIYDSSSSRVFFDKTTANMGLNTYNWDLTNQNGLEVSNGVYFMVLRFKQNDNTYVKRLKFAVLQ
ncbi:MAG: Ig-like domain repeat protein [Candidatus Cloacimonetes bacterium]|nr:Ig-like domain repeat protein [Candidatus Cloacimonadota bacterium]